MWRFRTSNPLVALGCGQFALSLTQAMFMFYYVKVYLNVFHVEQFWFNLAQVLFMIWNSINDPLFGYLQDKPGSWLNSRVAVIKYFSPFLVISFVFMWFPWSTTGSFWEGIHLILSLFFYDAFFSALGVAWSALFAETTKEPRLRVSAMKCTQISILFSVNIIAITEKLSHSLENMTNFRIISVVVACLSYLCYCIVGSFKESLPLTNSEDNKSLLSDSEPDFSKENPKQSTWDFAWKTTKEVVKERDFIAIVACNFIHQIRSVAHMNFASTATEVLISQDILPKGSLRLSLFFGVLTLLPQLLLIANERLVNRYGAYRLMMISYVLSVFSSVFYFSASNAYCNILFMVLDSITVHSVAPFFNIVISDFIDDDAKRNGRRSPISSVVFSLNALFVKPAQSLAPVFAVYFLNNFGYKDYLSSKTVSPSLVEGVAYLSFFTPLVLGALQFFILRPYSLGNRHIHREFSPQAMLINAVVLADSIRATIPCTLLSASMVPFATVSLGIGGLSWVLPKRAFIAMDNTLYRAYMRLCLFVFENVSGVQMRLHGDVDALRAEQKSALVLANHQSNVDWAIIMMLSARQGSEGHEAGFRVMVKQAIHMVPLFGWYIFQHGYIYVRRFGGFESGPVLRQLNWLNELGEKYWLMMFPEGTRYSKKYQKTIDASQEHCRQNGLPVLENVLCPRTGGANLALDHLNVDCVLDVTIAYGQTRNDGRRGRAPGMFEFCCGPTTNRTVDIYVKEYKMSDVPSDKEGRRKWIMDIFAQKDTLMDQFYKSGEFLDLKSPDEPSVSILRTLPSTLFFSAALIAPIFSPVIKKAYLYTIASSPLLMLWLRLRKCV